MSISKETYVGLTAAYQTVCITSEEMAPFQSRASTRRRRVAVNQLGVLIERIDPDTATDEDVAALYSALLAAMDQLRAAANDKELSLWMKFRMWLEAKPCR